MSSLSTTSAIILRRIDFGDYDVIVTILTLSQGKISMIAKYAKKSVKRFSGILELFSVIQVQGHKARGKGLYVLQEATLQNPFPKIRADINKTAYASYWSELINAWLEEGVQQVQLYYLLHHVLVELELDRIPEDVLSVLFQIKLMSLTGLNPNLNHCSICRIKTENIKKNRIFFDLVKGGLVCDKCASGSFKRILLSKGTIKQLLWLAGKDLAKAKRLRFSSWTLKEGLSFLEAFVPYHLEKEPRSLQFLRQIRK